jgi:c-di-GMP-binding flagellar brake protein YcgR
MPDGPSARPERRHKARRSCLESEPVSVLASLGEQHWQAPVRDISPTGIGMLLDQQLDPGALVAIELLNKQQQFWHLKLLRVVHATPHDGERWLVGSEFLKQFTDAEFGALFE